MFWRTVGRLILIPVAMLIAGLISGFVLVTLGLEKITQATQGNWQDADTIGGLYELLIQGQLLISGLTLVPALAVVIIGEVARIRSMLYYVLGGGLTFVAVPLFTQFGEAGAVSTLPTAVWQVFATAGFAGGFIYWLIAGRTA
ncbi:MAG TPA: hypothetical protein P5114_08010 [Hyphomicrobiaceae bacterium]|mgnify:CR=1 FL=1|nr:hypothetical protein [Hyphomicrobiaceae bacterium]